MTAAATSDAVVVDGVSKTFVPSSRLMSLLVRSPITEPVEALVDVSFSLRAGSTTVLLGANGAGKSTMLRILMGLIEADAGHASVLGRPAAERDPSAMRSIGFMASDDRSLYLRLTCEQNLRFHGHAHGMESAQIDGRIPEVLEAVGLAGMERHAAFALSSGMRARLQLARALIHRPTVLFLDEPTGTIDPLAAARLVELVGTTSAERGIATLMTTHRLDDLDVLDDDVMILSSGRVIHKGSVATLRDGAARGVYNLTFASRASTAAAANRLRPIWPHLASSDPTSTVLTLSAAEPLGRALHELGELVGELVDVAAVTPTLRQVLEALTEARQ